MEKTCGTCGQSKPITEFALKLGKPRSHCKPCGVQKTLQWRRVNHAAYTEGRRSRIRKDNLQSRFGMTVEEYNDLWIAQGGACAICGDSPGERNLSVDHCHETGAIRGLLCERCNPGLGYFKDSPIRLQAAIEYLESRR